MAAFASPPGVRIAYDANQSVVAFHDGSSVSATLATGDKQLLNDESASTSVAIPNISPCYLAVVFPYLRDIAAFGVRFGSGGTTDVETSVNTTNGIDGTWVAQGTVSSTLFTPAGAGHRTAFSSPASPALGVKGIRFKINSPVDLHAFGMHLYGGISAGQSIDILEFLDDQGGPLTAEYMDWGDVAQGSSDDKTILIRNRSATKTASTVLLIFEALTNSTPSVPGMHLISTDGGVTFQASGTVPTLGPSATATLVVRRVMPSDATVGVWDVRLRAVPGSYA